MRIKVPKHIFENMDALSMYLDGVKQGWGKRGACKELDNKRAQLILLSSKLTGSHGTKYGMFADYVQKEEIKNGRIEKN